MNFDSLPKNIYPSLEENFYPGSLQPSAPPSDALLIDWNILPPTRPLAWHENGCMRRLVGDIFLSLGTLSAGATAFSATLLVASAQTIIIATGGFALLAAALLVTGIAFHVLKSSPMDPELRLAKRQEIKQAIEKPDIPCYQSLKLHLDNTVLTADEINVLLHEDLLNMEYPLFIKKHGDKVLDALSSENLELLKSRYLQDVISKPNDGIKDLLNRLETRQLGFKEEDIISTLIEYEIFRLHYENKSYCEFISRNGHEAISYVKDPHSFSWLAAKFQEEVLDSMKGKGTIQANKQFAKDFHAFGPEVTNGILKNVTAQLLANQPQGAFNYQLIRQHSHMSDLEGFIKKCPEILAELRQAYLKMPYHDMKKYQNDQAILQINSEDIRKALREFWQEKSLQALVGSEDFFAALQEGFLNPCDLTDKILAQAQGMKIKDLLSLEPRLFTLEILKADTILPSGHTLSQALETEISHYRSFEKLLDDYSRLIFTNKLCSCQNLHLQKLALDFIYRRAESCITASNLGTISACLNVIETYQLLPVPEAKIFDEYKKCFISLKNQHMNLLAKSALNCQSLISQEERIKSETLKETVEASNIEWLSKRTRETLRRKNSLESLYSKEASYSNSLQNDYSNLKKQISDANSLLLSLQDRLATFSNLETKDLNYWHNCVTKKAQSIAKLEREKAFDLSNDSGIRQSKLSIDELKEQIHAEKERIALKGKYEALLQERAKLKTALSGSQSRKKILTTDIRVYKQQRAQAKGLVNAIRALQTPLSACERELEGILAKEKQLAQVNSQIESLSANLPTMNPSTLRELEQRLSKAQKAHSQAIQAVEGRYSLSHHRQELTQMQAEQKKIENAIVQKKTLENQITHERGKIVDLNTRKAKLKQTIKLSLENIGNYKRELKEATYHWEQANSEQTQVQSKLASHQKEMNAQLNARKKDFEEAREYEIYMENQRHEGEVSRLIEAFKEVIHSKLCAL